MVAPGLAKCNECAEEFKEDDTVFICEHCSEIFCDDCFCNHNCLEDEGADPTVLCDECGVYEDTDNAKQCELCKNIPNLCASCWKKHSKKHVEEDVVEEDYESYINNKVKEAI